MKTTTDNSPETIQELFDQKLSIVKTHARSFLASAVVVVGLYVASLKIAPGLITWLCSTIALVLIIITVISRIDDITPDQSSLRWQVRRVGLVLVAASAAGIAADPLLPLIQPGVTRGVDFPTWREVGFRWGMVLMLMTTPHAPAWWRAVSGKYKTVEDAKRAAASVTIAGLYDTSDRHPAFVSPEVAKAVETVEAFDALHKKEQTDDQHS